MFNRQGVPRTYSKEGGGRSTSGSSPVRPTTAGTSSIYSPPHGAVTTDSPLAQTSSDNDVTPDTIARLTATITPSRKVSECLCHIRLARGGWGWD